MGILYILSYVLLGISFMLIKKSESKQNFIKWLVLYFTGMFGFNIFLGMLFGLLNITLEIWLLSLINIVLSIVLSIKPIKNKDIQKYTVSKLDVFCICMILVIFVVMFVKDLYIFHGDITHYAIDSAIHYRAAKHYSENLKIFINCEDKTFFNFNVMQPGAYINDGIFMNVIHSITGAEHVYIYQWFETIVLFLGSLAFYTIIMDRVKTIRGAIGTLVLFALYIYGYPYNAWLYGFSYLAVGILSVCSMVTIVSMFYREEKINKKLLYVLVALMGTAIIFSYCLYVPAIFASICLYCFFKDFKQEGKTYLKIFKSTTLIVTGILLVITAVGIGYLFIPTFYIEGQTNLVSALQIDGAIYDELYKNFIMYIPFMILYAYDLIKRIKERNIKYLDAFAVCMIGYWLLMYFGWQMQKVSHYYFMKIYFILWPVIFACSIDVLNGYINWRGFPVDKIALIVLFVLMLNRVSAEGIFRTYLIIVLALYTVLPYFLKNVDFKKFKEKLFGKIKNENLKEYMLNIGLKVTPLFYTVAWGLFVACWIWLKAGYILPEDQKHALPNLVGIYYIENTEYRKLNDLMTNFNKNEVALAKYARENIDDLTADNLEIIFEGYHTRVWATALTEVSSDKIPYENYIQDTRKYTIDDIVKENKEKKYILRVIKKDPVEMEESKKDLDKHVKDGIVEVLFENENGYVAKINR